MDGRESGGTWNRLMVHHPKCGKSQRVNVRAPVRPLSFPPATRSVGGQMCAPRDNAWAFAGGGHTMDTALAEAWNQSLGNANVLQAPASDGDPQMFISNHCPAATPVLPAFSAEGVVTTPPLRSQGGSTPAAAQPPPWYKHTAFVQFTVCAAVFLSSFIILIAIRPPFLYKKRQEKLAVEEFSAMRAFYVSLGVTVLCAILMVTLSLLAKYKVM